MIWSKLINIPQSDFAYSYDLHCLTNSVKGISLLCKASLWCVLLRLRSIPRWLIDTSQSGMPIWWGKFELECLLIIFIYLNPKCKVTCKNVDFECRFIKTHFEEKSIKFVLFQSPLFFFSSKFFNYNRAILSREGW